jgi:hypothetical protein
MGVTSVHRELLPDGLEMPSRIFVPHEWREKGRGRAARGGPALTGPARRRSGWNLRGREPFFYPEVDDPIVSFGRVQTMTPPVRDQSLQFTGAALVLVGLFEALFGLVLTGTCNVVNNGVCVGREDPAGGLVLGVAGILVLVAGVGVYLVSRRTPRP